MLTATLESVLLNTTGDVHEYHNMATIYIKNAFIQIDFVDEFITIRIIVMIADQISNIAS